MTSRIYIYRSVTPVGASNAFTTGNPFSATKLLGFRTERSLGALKRLTPVGASEGKKR